MNISICSPNQISIKTYICFGLEHLGHIAMFCWIDFSLNDSFYNIERNYQNPWRETCKFLPKIGFQASFSYWDLNAMFFLWKKNWSTSKSTSKNRYWHIDIGVFFNFFVNFLPSLSNPFRIWKCFDCIFVGQHINSIWKDISKKFELIHASKFDLQIIISIELRKNQTQNNIHRQSIGVHPR